MRLVDCSTLGKDDSAKMLGLLSERLLRCLPEVEGSGGACKDSVPTALALAASAEKGCAETSANRGEDVEDFAKPGLCEKAVEEGWGGGWKDSAPDALVLAASSERG